MITDADLKMFKSRSRTELESKGDMSRMAWDVVVPALCDEVAELRRKLEAATNDSGFNAAKAREATTTENSAVVGNAAAMREAVASLRKAITEIRDDVLDMVKNGKSDDPDSYAHGLCLSIGGACDMALNATKEFDNAD